MDFKWVSLVGRYHLHNGSEPLDAGAVSPVRLNLLPGNPSRVNTSAIRAVKSPHPGKITYKSSEWRRPGPHPPQLKLHYGHLNRHRTAAQVSTNFRAFKIPLLTGHL